MRTRPAAALVDGTRLALASAAASGLVATLLAACLPLAPVAAPAGTDELRQARAFDQQGVAAFEAGRYRDALLYFQASRAHGGPPSERWNEAKCLLRLEDVEQAEAAFVAYLESPGLTTEDRREAEASLQALRHRPSVLTVMSSPLGLAVSVDGRRLGVTPLSASVASGEHLVMVQRGSDAHDDRTVSARLGRPIILEARP